MASKSQIQNFSHFINGESVKPDSGEWIESMNPKTGDIWARIARGNEVDVEKAVNAASDAWQQTEWQQPTYRAAVLSDIANIIDKNFTNLIELEVNDNGKCIREVKKQFASLGSWYRYFSEALSQAANDQVDSEQLQGHVRVAVQRLPYGVVGAITAWNSPLMIAAWKVAPALAAGNSVVIKPSELASVSTVEFAELFKHKIPRGIINVLTGYGNEAGSLLVSHELVRKITFTGSEIGGINVAKNAAEHVKPSTLELGGKSAQIVLADADLDQAVNGIMSGIFLSNGQTCVAGSRLLVEKSVKRALLDKILARLKKLTFGDPMLDTTDIGPIANEQQFEKVLAMIRRAQHAGARIIVGGSQVTASGLEGGYFIAPTILENVSTDSEIWMEEVFGPVLCITSFESVTDAIFMANESKYGLAAGIWCKDKQKAFRIAEQLQVGTVYVNHYRSVSPEIPVGGVKRSGYGRELGPNSIQDFQIQRAIWQGQKAVSDPFAI